MTEQEQIRTKVVRTRAEQGLPPTIQDPATLDRVAAVFRVVDTGAAPEGRGEPRVRPEASR